jgi:thioesterase domain-containing protein
MWADVLDRDEVGIEDDFFDLGGESILAAELLARVAEEGLGPGGLPLSTLLWAPTVSELADVLETDGWKPPAGSLVPLRSGGEGPPLFLAHDHGGDPVTYGLLAHRLKPGRPVYGIEWRAPDTLESTVAVSVQKLAEAYAAEIRSLRPQGPYFLAGSCLGGAIALEIANNLAAAGGEIGAVALIMPIADRPGRLRVYWRRLAYHRRKGRLVRGVAAAAGRRLRTASERIRGTAAPAPPDPAPPALKAASSSYLPRPYGGAVSLLVGENYLTPRRFWEKIAQGGVTVYPLRGGMIFREPAVDQLAEQLDRALEEAAPSSFAP